MKGKADMDYIVAGRIHLVCGVVERKNLAKGCQSFSALGSVSSLEAAQKAQSDRLRCGLWQGAKEQVHPDGPSGAGSRLVAGPLWYGADADLVCERPKITIPTGYADLSVLG